MKEKYQILIVDDEIANLQKLKRTFLEEYQVWVAQGAGEALRLLRMHPIAAVITDQRMPGTSGVELLRESLTINPDAVRIILTGYTEVEDLMEAINQGQVHRYITKPWEPFALKQAVRQELERWHLKRENERLAHELQRANERLQKENFQLKQEISLLSLNSRLLYRSQSMEGLIRLLDRVVQTDSTVLIQGETGTGKELIARYIHEQSARSDQAFIPLNCGAIPAELVESSFFGHHKGAFTGATENRKGYFELADGGTLFLDEIGEAPLDLQVKLLRVLQDGEIFPVGAQAPRRIDVRIVASTNRNLSRMVEEKSFRQDLFFRLNVFSVYVPPLRARQEDIELLCDHFLDLFCRRLNKDIPGFDEDARRLLRDYSWPGNVRELQNDIERMVLICESGCPIRPDLLSDRIRFHNHLGHSRGSLKDRLAELERRMILEALRLHDQNKSHAAETLGISRQTIIAKLKQYEN